MLTTKVAFSSWICLRLANAIPIEGWISDPTDNDLLHLIPFLRALRFVNDVRSLLGLRTGARKT